MTAGEDRPAVVLPPAMLEQTMTTIIIPLEARLLTLQIEEFAIREVEVDVGGRPQLQRRRVRTLRNIAHGHDASRIAPAVQHTNIVFRPARIRFVLRRAFEVTTRSPLGREALDNQDFHLLSRQFPGGSFVSLMLVHQFARGELGGQSLEPAGTAIIEAMGQSQFNRVLCHELGHLLNLHHEGPGNVDNYNLMYPALRAGNRLDPEQISSARESRLATRAVEAARQGRAAINQAGRTL
jgi:hypothetical protein